jgi:2-dehydropantoate 2-reductase
MKILVIGAGVIGTIYGYILAQSGNDVTHYVRPGRMKSLENGIKMRLLDGRENNPQNKDILYSIKLTETLTPSHDYDLILVSVRHYQIESVLPLLKANLGKADILFFNGIWDNLEHVDGSIPREKYIWGFPVAGGGYTKGSLDAALLDEIRIGEIDGQKTPRLECIADLFRQTGLKVDTQSNILHWLWVHFAINCGVIAAGFKAGGAKRLLNSIPNLRLGILAGREALDVCKARGVDTLTFVDAKPFYMNALFGAAAVWFMMKGNAPARKIMESHSAVDELQKMYYDLLETADDLEIKMPVYTSLKPFVDNPKMI